MSTIKIPGQAEPLAIHQIRWLEGDGNYTRFHLHNKKVWLASKTLKIFESQLVDFVRISKSGLINPDFIKQVNLRNVRKSSILLDDGTEIAVSRRRTSQIAVNLAELNLGRTIQVK